MKRKLKNTRARKLGLEPGTVVYVGDKATESPIKLSLFEYNDVSIQESEMKQIIDCVHDKTHQTVKWLNVDGVHNSQLIEEIGKKFNLHALLLEDVSNTQQRPKLEEYDNTLFLIVKMLSYNEQEKRIEVEQLSLVLGNNFLISFQEDKEGDILDPIRERLRIGKQKIRKSGADYLLYCILDMIIDHYFVILEKLGEEMNELEESIITDTSHGLLRTIYRMKRDMISLRRNIWPMREMLSNLERSENELLTDSTNIYFRDIYDHAIQAIETIEMYRDMLSGMLDIFLSSSSNHMNGIMKVLTTISTIFIPLTFIVGLYGMNFDYMPELHWKYGYLSVWVLMGLSVLTMAVYFKRKKWF
jgi:magnesium transporter